MKRRDILRALPALAVPMVAIGAQEPQEPPMRAPVGWDYDRGQISAWSFSARRGPSERVLADLTEQDWAFALAYKQNYLIDQGRKGWSVASVHPSVYNGAEMVTVIQKRPNDESKRVVWEHKTFRPTNNPGDPYRQYKALGRQGWEIYYAPTIDGVPDMIHAQRVVPDKIAEK